MKADWFRIDSDACQLFDAGMSGKLIQIAVAHDGGPNGADVLEHYFHEASVPALSRAMDVTIDGALYTVWNFADAAAAQRIVEEFAGIDVSTLGPVWLAANAARLNVTYLDE